jgi:hypothetical protein
MRNMITSRLILFGLFTSAASGCGTNDPYRTDWFAVNSLSVQRLASAESDPPVFFLIFQFKNLTSDQQVTYMTHFEVDAGAAKADFAIDAGGTIVGDCGTSSSRNPIFDVASGESHEVRARIELPPSPSPDLTVSCKPTYPTEGFADGYQTEGIWSKNGTFSPTYSGPFEVVLIGRTGQGEADLFEATAMTDTILPPP